MIVLRDPSEVCLVTDPDIAAIAEGRFQAMSEEEPYDPDINGPLYVVEPGDTVEQLADMVGFSVLDPDVPFEVLEEHPTCYELVIVPGDGDFAIVLFVPKLDGVCPELLAFCEAHATP
jgi:hypothetical protein